MVNRYVELIEESRRLDEENRRLDRIHEQIELEYKKIKNGQKIGIVKERQEVKVETVGRFIKITDENKKVLKVNKNEVLDVYAEETFKIDSIECEWSVFIVFEEIIGYSFFGNPKYEKNEYQIKIVSQLWEDFSVVENLANDLVDRILELI